MVNILPFDHDSGQIFGILKAQLGKLGIGCIEPDLRFAAVAIQYNLTPITSNTKMKTWGSRMHSSLCVKNEDVTPLFFLIRASFSNLRP